MLWNENKSSRCCPSCGSRVPRLLRVLAVYNMTINCVSCGRSLEISGPILIVNTILAGLCSVVVMQFMSIERNIFYFLISAIWTLFIFLPIISLVCFSVKKI